MLRIIILLALVSGAWSITAPGNCSIGAEALKARYLDDSTSTFINLTAVLQDMTAFVNAAHGSAITAGIVHQHREYVMQIAELMRMLDNTTDWYLACLDASDSNGGPTAQQIIANISVAIEAILSDIEDTIADLTDRIVQLNGTNNLVRQKRQLSQLSLNQLQDFVSLLSGFLETFSLVLQLMTGPKASIACRASPDSISVTVYDGVGFNVVNAYVVNKKSLLACRATSGDGTLSNPFSMSIAPGAPCGVTGSGTQNDPYRVRILAVKSDVIESKRDVVFDVTCRGPTSQNVITAGTPVTDLDFTTGIFETPRESLELEMINDRGNVINSCALGERIRLRVTLEQSATARGVRVINVNSFPSESNRSPTAVLLSNGCPVPSNPSDIILNAGFNAPTGGTGNVVTSGEFICFRYPDEDTVTMEAVVQFCTADSDPTCTTQPSCGGQTRKKRSTEEGTKEESVSATFKVYINEEARIASANGESKNNTLNQQAASELPIWQSTAFIATLCACVVSMLAVILMAIFIAFRVRSSRQVDK